MKIRDFILSKRKSAFTLIELLIVIAILCIIAAVVIPNLVKSPTSVQVVPTGQGNLVQIETITIDSGWNSATPMQDAIANWVKSHPKHKLISVIRVEESNRLVITSSLVEPTSEK